MAISKQSYTDLKEYWDYQRLLEYNRELLKERLSKVNDTVYAQFAYINTDSMYDKIWNDIRPEDLETPVVGWVPKDEKYRIEDA
jgi:hypothetical protein